MENIIEVQGLSKYYKDVKAVDQIGFTVAKGELFGFLGENGAGKSTTINMLCTLQSPTGGTARVCGYLLEREQEKIKGRIGVVYQNNCLDGLLTVRENLLTRGRLYEKDTRKLKKNLAQVVEVMNLGEILGRPFAKLSGGQKRRCEIARALMHTPDLIFLDEPTTGLDPVTRKYVWEAIASLRKELQTTVFLTTHYMEEAARADHIGIMDHGHFVEYGTPFSLKEKYASDKLVLIPAAGCREGLISYLEARDLKYRLREERIAVKIEHTLAALPLLDALREKIEGFEVVQGSMDDVFMNAVGGNL